MAHFIVGRLFGWPEFAEDGDDIWLIHIEEPTFFLRVIHRPEDLMPSGDLNDLYFPLEDDNRYAVGNLIFVEPRPADPREVAQVVAMGIKTIQHEDVTRLLALPARPFNPSSAELQPEDVPVGFVAGIFHDSESCDTDLMPWIAHLGPPPFAMRVCDLNDVDLEPDDIWANAGDGFALAHLHWLSSLASEREDIRFLAETAAGIVADALEDIMPDLIPS
ncbi:MAG: hypothetical protein CL573_01430 [Alphaproteobacteria bacterium]|nr:hypothetical protein [Alphaproteobacteria bacterium]HCP00214.1 hypothetical protein [Rhodospirillaceae bacterium]